MNDISLWHEMYGRCVQCCVTLPAAPYETDRLDWCDKCSPLNRLNRIVRGIGVLPIGFEELGMSDE